MNKMNWIIAILVGIAVVCTLITYAESQQASPVAYVPPVISTSTSTVSPAHPITPSKPVQTTGTTTLALGQKAQIADLTFTPLTIVEDGRCPLGVMCIRGFQNTFQVSVRITSYAGSVVQTLTLGQPFTIGHDILTLSGVQPVKRMSATIAPSDYQLTFTVQPAP